VRTLTFALVLCLLAAACGSSEESADTTSQDKQTSSAADLDPCSLVDDDTLAAYFGSDVPASETATYGPIEACTWSNANANSLTVQTARDYALNRLDGCDECVELTFGDEGYAAPSVVQSTATFVAGDMWYSVTTTGFGDDATSIADLGETILANASP